MGLYCHIPIDNQKYAPKSTSKVTWVVSVQTDGTLRDEGDDRVLQVDLANKNAENLNNHMYIHDYSTVVRHYY